MFGWSTSDFVARRFGKENGDGVLRASFGSVEWHEHPSTMVITDPADVEAYISIIEPRQQEAVPRDARCAPRGHCRAGLGRGRRARGQDRVGLLRVPRAGEGTW